MRMLCCAFLQEMDVKGLTRENVASHLQVRRVGAGVSGWWGWAAAGLGASLQGWCGYGWLGV